MKKIKYSQQNIDQCDIDSVVNVLKSEYLTQGPQVEEFEENIAKYVGVEFAISSNSATSSLHLACLALGLGQGDWLWTCPNSFVASANCGLYCGANVDFVDIDDKYRNIDLESLKKKLKIADAENKLPKLLILVHFAGFAANLSEIRKLSEQYKFKIIEDASHALGGEYRKQKIGNCRWSDITVFSFHAVKNITTGEGGIATTRSKKYFNQMLLMRSHGITRTKEKLSKTAGEPWYYEQQVLGFNYRMSSIHAALGTSQLKKLDNFINKKSVLAGVYFKELENTSIFLPLVSSEIKPSWHLFVINERKLLDQIFKRKVVENLKLANIEVNVHYIPIHLQPFYQKMGFTEGMYPQSEYYFKTALSLPLHPGLEKEDILYVCQKLKNEIFG